MNIDEVLRRELTTNQFNAANDTAHDVLCLACAGSGKSRTLAYRIARLLAAGEPPEGIVAFTFTDKAAESIKRRVSQALLATGLDATTLGAMYIGTIHSYCQRILGKIDVVYRQYDVLDENRLKLYLISRYGDLGLHGLRGRKKCKRYFDTIELVANAWKTANDELLDFGAVLSEDAEVGHLLVSIRERLRKEQYIDFSLMIRDAVEVIRNNAPGVENGVGLLKHLMVDEYQDVNPCQEELIRLLRRRADTIFVVGDDDQSIYAWRGADISNILGFQERYVGCSVHTLSQNFRSTEPIVQASNGFAGQFLGPSRIGKQPTAPNNLSPQDFRVLWFPDREREAEWVSGRIVDLLGTAYNDNGLVRGLTPADFAVLMRSSRVSEQNLAPRHAAFTEALRDKGVPFSLEAGGGPFDNPQTAALRSTFELLRNSPPDRKTVQQHFDEAIEAAYPDADFDALVGVLAEWGRQIHRPRGSTRIRLYPQQLVPLHSDFDCFRQP